MGAHSKGRKCDDDDHDDNDDDDDDHDDHDDDDHHRYFLPLLFCIKVFVVRSNTKVQESSKAYIFISNIVMMMSKPYVFISKNPKVQDPLVKSRLDISLRSDCRAT